jgi:ParB family chromosome partitioning protein
MSDKSREKRGLGRGLSALMADVNIADSAEAPPRRAEAMMPIERLRPNPDQPRRDFVRQNLEELAASIRERGVIQPLIVRPDPGRPDAFQIVAGERRWRAAQMAQLHEVPVLVRDLDDTEVLEVAIIENIQRADLNPVEEAQGYRQLMDRFGHTQEKMAEALGKSRSHIANLLRLLSLPDEVLTHLREGRITAGHARALITTENPAELCRQVVARGLSVREVERLAKGPGAPRARPRGRTEKDADTRALETDLAANLGMRVAIDHRPGTESGVLSIGYDTLGQLDELCRLLTSMPRDESI